MLEGKTIYRYRAFSLEIESELRLPELVPSSGLPDLTVRIGPGIAGEFETLSNRQVALREKEATLFWAQAGSFTMSDGREINIDPVPGALETLLRSGILGPALATILQQRGSLVLHASAVVINGGCVGFIGWKGQGKSTTAASLFARGHSLLTDDLLALNGESPTTVLAHPGYPQMKLWPDSALSALDEAPEGLPKLMDGHEKRAKTIKKGFRTKPAPMSAIYLLSTGPCFAVRRLDAHGSFKAVLANTFCARYGNQFFKGEAGAAHFRNVARLVANVPVFALERRDALGELDRLADFVVNHQNQLQPSLVG